jgi:hypothetical protein
VASLPALNSLILTGLAQVKKGSRTESEFADADYWIEKMWL